MNKSYLFNTVPSVSIQRSVFDRSHNYKTTIEGDYLYPVLVDEIYPGDSINIKANIFARMATQVVPLLDNAYLDVFFFFVPRRLVWEHWQNFMGETSGPSDTTEYLLPQLKSETSLGADSGFSALSIYDYLGVPCGKVKTWMDACYLRAYNLIYNEWFRDENLIDTVAVNTDDGPDFSDEYTLLKRSKARDYFTSALPWPQKGPASSISLTGSAPLVGDLPVFGNSIFDSKKSLSVGDSSNHYNNSLRLSVKDTDYVYPNGAYPDNNTSLRVDLADGGYADLSGVSDITINQLRTSYQFQRFLERNARAGTRYTEIIRSHFGVVSPDARLQRPEFLGMWTQKVNIQAIAQNSSTDGTTPQGNLAGIGTIASTSAPIIKSFVEHGILMCLVNLRGDISYDQGMPRIFGRRTRNDFFWPTFAHLGEQAILNKEIFCQGDSVTDSDGNIVDEKVFGYIPRYDELRFAGNQITGMLRGSYSSSLNVWTLAEEFANLPGLNQTFIEQNTPFARAQAVSSQPVFLLDIFFKSIFTRPLPTFGVPGWVDHF